MTIRSAFAAAGSVAAIALAAGCGSGAHPPSSATGPTSTFPTTSSPGSRLGPAGGRELFAQACEVCHSISGHSRPSQQGGDLRSFHGSRAQLRQLTAEMPVVHHRLTPAQVDAVVAYVAAVESGSR